jgi:hypothetical protein
VSPFYYIILGHQVGILNIMMVMLGICEAVSTLESEAKAWYTLIK